MKPRDWAELLRVSALFTVPGDALAGAASAGGRPNRGTALAVGASLCLYEAGMALNDWSDRDEDAIDRPHRPIPSGRISPRAALGAAGALTAAGLGLAARAGRPALAVATALSATVWAYDLHLKHTKAGPAAMAAARGLDLLMGAAATLSAAGSRTAAGGGTAAARPDPTVRGARWAATNAAAAAGGPAPAARPAQGAAARGQGPAPAPSRPAFPAGRGGGGVRAAAPAAAVLAAHTYGVTTVSRNETQGGSTRAPLAALAATGAVAAFAARPRGTAAPAAALVLAAAYARTAAVPYLHAALNPSPPLTQRAVGGGIRAMIPLQAALAARSGAGLTGLAVMGLVPLARKLARKVSPT
ncbi:UbiA family prenyltransferase [Streptomyces sp. Tu 2975]|uniref:SCO3242 family prenyltransferase n=1 Tax=Streptomyces sp. Tu 2975 TaxID=2676871 RepID=UPI00135A71E6|nr:UbiA family prenyltransferase [Streptomyces sp. Tu 2975]QIP83671.1 UbiA family prenyltransferase [Streptomyces sp. Tu 2975]